MKCPHVVTKILEISQVWWMKSTHITEQHSTHSHTHAHARTHTHTHTYAHTHKLIKQAI